MREILFRGQTRRKGEKVYMNGNPVPSNWVYGGIFPQNRGGDFAIIYQQDPEIKKFTVYADTVGQYTGLVDKNGNKIFEGDIVKYIIGKGEYEFAEFEYGNIIFLNGGFQIAGKPCDLCVCSFDTKDFDLEVIGNIYDNPELLKS